MDVCILRDNPPEKLDQFLDREAHVWLFDSLLASDELWKKKLTNILSAEERARANRFVFEPQRRLFTVAHGGLRNILSKYADIKPEQWQFDIGEHGRPEIAPAQNAEHLRFNLSHTRGLVACLINRQYDCGVDLEKIERTRDGMSLARRFFSPFECAELEKCRSDEELCQLFYRYWTLKEAYVKALGQGLRISLSSFYFTIEENQVQLHFDEETTGRQENWQLYQQRPTDEHILSVAIKIDAKKPLKVRLFDY